MKPSRIARAPKEFLVTILDKANGDRLKYRALHMQNIPSAVGSPITNAGAILGEDGKLIGSHFNLRVNNEAEIISFLKNDVYAKNGVWDFDSIKILPILVATREGKKFDL